MRGEDLGELHGQGLLLGIPLAVSQLRAIDQLAEAAEEPRLEGRDGQVAAVGGRVDPVAGEAAGEQAPERLAAEAVGGQLVRAVGERDLNVASTAGFQPVPFMATYAATKAFVLSFSEALWEENRLHGIKVMALCPGVTETNFFAASRMQRPPVRTAQTPEEVVEVGLRALRRSKGSVISGWTNRLMVETERLVPRALILRAAGAVLRSHLEKG